MCVRVCVCVCVRVCVWVCACLFVCLSMCARAACSNDVLLQSNKLRPLVHCIGAVDGAPASNTVMPLIGNFDTIDICGFIPCMTA